MFKENCVSTRFQDAIKFMETLFRMGYGAKDKGTYNRIKSIGLEIHIFNIHFHQGTVF